MDTMRLWAELAVLLASIVVGARLGGIGLGPMGGLGLFVFVFLFGLPPGGPPVQPDRPPAALSGVLSVAVKKSKLQFCSPPGVGERGSDFFAEFWLSHSFPSQPGTSGDDHEDKADASGSLDSVQLMQPTIRSGGDLHGSNNWRSRWDRGYVW